jgi:hypothetical protein
MPDRVCGAVKPPLSLVDPPPDPPAPWWAARLQELSERELRLLAVATAEHVPAEVRFNLEQLEHERERLLAEHGAPRAE